MVLNINATRTPVRSALSLLLGDVCAHQSADCINLGQSNISMALRDVTTFEIIANVGRDFSAAMASIALIPKTTNNLLVVTHVTNK